MVAVVDKGVADACSGRKSNGIARRQRVQLTVYPGVRMTFKHKDKLFFRALRVRIGHAASGQQPFMVNAEAG
ncbi:hypothetical protein XB02_10950 [Pantoea ananatis]|nr:hypothetical protein XB02_10950 [Pantoea ananatis]